jgi:hypothetical protein
MPSQRGIYLLLDFHPYLGYASTSASCATSCSAATASRTWSCWSGPRSSCRPLEAIATRFSPRLPDANALLKMVREEAAAYAREHGGRRVEADADAVRRSCATCRA